MRHLGKTTKLGVYVSACYGGILAASISCSTTQIVPPPAPPAAPTPPPYIQVPHPSGFDLGDIRAIFIDRTAPTTEALKTCDADFKKLYEVTLTEDERKQGTRELVQRNPVQYHWCFYWKVINLEETLKAETYIDERQKLVLNAYLFLGPIARGFMTEFHDSRYLRWAVVHYKKMSEWVFYRRLELSPQETASLVQVANPFGFWRDPIKENSVLDKYGIAQKPEAVTEVPPTAPQDVPASPSRTTAQVPPALPSTPETLPALEPEQPTEPPFPVGIPATDKK